jgi:hypothetical protein
VNKQALNDNVLPNISFANSQFVLNAGNNNSAAEVAREQFLSLPGGCARAPNTRNWPVETLVAFSAWTRVAIMEAVAK